ncbi:tRNA lysidine(34) synthetase TilS, partial [Clostridium chrysemydis]|uniref:tRNA lysidine(34) synthetase TilS n=1 Tax=Clostridium chrysemydis TaxID=2665504 RepID=UPI003F329142
IIIKKELFLGDKAIITRVIRKSLTNVSKSIYDFELKHINDVISLNNIGTNKRIDLPNGIIAENIYGDIEIKKKEALDKSFKKEETEIIIEKKDIDKEELEYLGYNFKFQVLKDAKKLKFNNNDLIKYFDYDKLNKCVILRARKNGDKIVPFGMKGSKKLKDIFINMKLPKNQRDITPILQFDDNIAWVVDVKLSDIFKVTKDTKTILKVICEKRG